MSQARQLSRLSAVRDRAKDAADEYREIIITKIIPKFERLKSNEPTFKHFLDSILLPVHHSPTSPSPLFASSDRKTNLHLTPTL